MSDQVSLRSASAAIEAAARWVDEQSTSQGAALAQVDQELATIRDSIANLQQQLEELTRKRAEVEAQAAGFADEAATKAYDELFAVLAEQAAALGARGDEIVAAEAAQAAAIEAALSDPATRSLLDQHNQFRTTVEPTLAVMPEAYRNAILGAHEAMTAQLKARLAEVDQGPAVSQGPDLQVDVVFAVDAPEGAAEVLMLVLPVPDTLHEDWASAPESVAVRLAARAVQAVYQACASVGFPAASAMFGPHKGLLAVEVELPGGDPEQYIAAVQTALDQVLSEAPELVAAKVVARGFVTEADHVLPPAGDEEEGDAE